MIHADSDNIQLLVQFLGYKILNFGSDFPNVWLASINVAISFSKSLKVFIWFHTNARNFNPRKINFGSLFSSCRALKISIKRCGFFAHLLLYMKSMPEDAHLLKRPRECSKIYFLFSVLRK